MSAVGTVTAVTCHHLCFPEKLIRLCRVLESNVWINSCLVYLLRFFRAVMPSLIKATCSFNFLLKQNGTNI
jgi:hypothetical protein